MTIQRFEDLEAWKEARVLGTEVYKLVRQGEEFKRDYRFRDQITAAAVSTMSNIAEGFVRKSDREFPSFSLLPKARAPRFRVFYTRPSISIT